MMKNKYLAYMETGYLQYDTLEKALNCSNLLFNLLLYNSLIEATNQSRDNHMNRDKIIENLAQKWTNNADLDAVLEFFYNEQKKYLEELTDEDLLIRAEEDGIDKNGDEIE